MPIDLNGHASILRDPESRSYKLFDIIFVIRMHPTVKGFRLSFQESFRSQGLLISRPTFQNVQLTAH